MDDKLKIDISKYTYADQNALASAERKLKALATLEALINSGSATPEAQSAYLKALDTDPVQANFDATCNMFAKCVVSAPDEWFEGLTAFEGFGNPATYHKLRIERFGELTRAITEKVTRPKV